MPRAGTQAVDLGGGRGQLTIPVAQLARGYRFLVVDRFEGPYARSRRRLGSAAAALGLSDRIAVRRAEALAWLQAQPSGGFDAILSGEFLPELTSATMQEVLQECHRCLRPAGTCVHLFLSPTPRNKRQSLFIEADADPRWSKRPPVEWFSPPPRLVAAQLRAAGFTGVATERSPSGVAVRGDAARDVLSKMAVKAAFVQAHGAFLDARGLEVPDWVVAVGRKGPGQGPDRA
jgi:SAM-dependent methyltransferase